MEDKDAIFTYPRVDWFDHRSTPPSPHPVPSSFDTLNGKKINTLLSWPTSEVTPASSKKARPVKRFKLPALWQKQQPVGAAAASTTSRRHGNKATRLPALQYVIVY